MAYEKVTLYGVPIVAQRKVNYGRIDPEAQPRAVHPQRARRGRLAHPPQVLRRQPQAPQRGRGAGAPGPAPGHPGGRRDALRLLRPAGARTRRLRRALRLLVEAQAPRASRSSSTSSARCSSTRAAEAVTKDDYPDSWRQGQLKFRVTYQFEPGADADGVTVHIPLQVLNQVTDEGFDWQIPGLREEVVTELIRSLPEADPPPLRPGAELREALPGPGGAPAGAAAGDAGPRAPADGRRAGRRAEDFDLGAGPRPPEDHLPDRRRAAPQARRGQGPGGAAAAAEAEGPPGPLPGRRGHRRARGRRVPGAHGPDGLDDRHAHRASSRPGGPASRSRRTRRWSTRATTVSVRLFDTEAEQAAGDVAGHPAADPAATSRSTRRSSPRTS